MTMSDSNPPPVHDFDAPNGILAIPSQGESAWLKFPSEQQIQQITGYCRARLGLASSLLLALAAKYRPAAMHSVRVAIGAEGWAQSIGLPADQTRTLELAGALHDLGKVGLCDSILQKPTRLTPEEHAIVDYHRHNALSILQPSLASREMAETIYFGIAHFDGSKPEFQKSGYQLPLTARMLAIVDAYDSMTMESCYRDFRTSAEAIAELFSQGDRQFDLELVHSFAKYVDTPNVWTNSGSISNWMSSLRKLSEETHWTTTFNFKTAGQLAFDRAYEKSLLVMMNDGVAFLDMNQVVTMWSPAAEEITGISVLEIYNRRWPWPQLEPHDKYDLLLGTGLCPVARCIAQQKPASFEGSIEGAKRSRIAVTIEASPVLSSSRVMLGVVVVIQDTSSEKSLKQRLKQLTIAANTDPLTNVANRNEFDRVFEQILVEHVQQKSPFCVIFTDIDYFKRINDDYGHDAGDAALVGFASHLSRHCRLGDLVSRLGGEEFAILCPETDINRATERAEQMRTSLQALPVPSLKNRCLTASFGVAELQAGDTPESLLRRADRALRKAKLEGRNRVVSLSGYQEAAVERQQHLNKEKNSMFDWLFGRGGEVQLQLKKELQASVPREVVIEKIKGFINDFNAEIESVSPESVRFTLDSAKTELSRRTNDRHGVFRLDLMVRELDGDQTGAKTTILVSLSQMGRRNRRQPELLQALEHVYQNLRSYLVAKEKGEQAFGALEPAATRPGDGRV